MQYTGTITTRVRVEASDPGDALHALAIFARGEEDGGEELGVSVRLDPTTAMALINATENQVRAASTDDLRDFANVVGARVAVAREELARRKRS